MMERVSSSPELFSATRTLKGRLKKSEEEAVSLEEEAKRNLFPKAAAAIVSCLLWSLVSSGLVFLNKFIMSHEGFNFPMALSCLGMSTSSVLSYVCVYRLKMIKRSVRWSGAFLATTAFPIGFCTALTLYLGNLAYLYLSVAYVQILKGTTPIATLGAGVLFLDGRGEDARCSRSLLRSLTMISFGVFLASYADLHFSLRGFLAMASSVVFEAVKVITMQKSMHHHKLHALEALSIFAPPCAFCLAIGTFLLEREGLLAYGFAKIFEKPLLYAAAGSLGFLLNLLVLWVIQAAGSVTFKVVAMLKNVLVVLGSVVIFNHHIATVEASGYFISLLGFYSYHVAKTQGDNTFSSSEEPKNTRDKISKSLDEEDEEEEEDHDLLAIASPPDKDSTTPDCCLFSSFKRTQRRRIDDEQNILETTGLLNAPNNKTCCCTTPAETTTTNRQGSLKSAQLRRGNSDSSLKDTTPSHELLLLTTNGATPPPFFSWMRHFASPKDSSPKRKRKTDDQDSLL